MKWVFQLFGREIRVLVGWRDRRIKDIFGYSSRCTDGKQVLFIDYDNLEKEWVIDEVKYLQEAFHLSDAYLFQSSKDGFHIVIPDKLTYGEIITILRNATVDPNYIIVPTQFGKKLFTLRVSKKEKNKRIKFLQVINSRYNEKIKSLPHLKFLKNHFGIDVNSNNSDNLKKMVIAKYKW